MIQESERGGGSPWSPLPRAALDPAIPESSVGIQPRSCWMVSRSFRYKSARTTPSPVG